MAKQGERVRVTTEGVVTWASKSGVMFEIDGVGFDTDDGSISVEVLTDPLPTTAGSVVQQGRDFFHLAPDGSWVSDDAEFYEPSELLGGNPTTVLFVAP